MPQDGPPAWVTPSLIVPSGSPVEHRERGRSSAPTHVFTDIPERYRMHLDRIRDASDSALANSQEAVRRADAATDLASKSEFQASTVGWRLIQAENGLTTKIAKHEEATSRALTRQRQISVALGVATLASLVVSMISVSIAVFAITTVLGH